MTQFTSLDPFRAYCALPVAPYFRREFARVGATEQPNIRIRYTRAGNPPWDVLIERRGRQFTLVLEETAPRLFTRNMRHMVCAYAYWLSRCPPVVTRTTVNASDGDVVSNARFGPSVRFPHQVALPDPYYFRSNGFAAELLAGELAPAWSERSDDIVWRGGMNGCGWLSLAPQDLNNPAVLPRLRLVMHLARVPNADARLVDIHRTIASSRQYAHREGLLGGSIPARSWLGRKYALDIDGYANTWSNLLVRMLFGCCVLKVESQLGFRQWYYEGLRPFEHYVPVAADMSDLAEKIDWVRSHDADAKAIAAQGQAFASSLTFESQAHRAAELIEQHWD